MPFNSKTGSKAGKKSKRGPAKKQEPNIKLKMELLYEKVLNRTIKKNLLDDHKLRWGDLDI